MSTKRWDEYRGLFKRLGIDDGLARLHDNGGVTLIVRSTGIVGRGTAKGYVYSEQPLSPLVDSLDGGIPKPDTGRRDCIAFRSLQGNWYLFY